MREFFDGYLIVGGGISDGWGVAGAIASGADFVYMGTRFIPTLESMAPAAYKQMVVDCSVDDLVISAGISGTPASWLKPSIRAAGLDPDNMPDAPGPANTTAAQSFAGKKWMDVWAAGQGLGTIQSNRPHGLASWSNWPSNTRTAMQTLASPALPGSGTERSALKHAKET